MTVLQSLTQQSIRDETGSSFSYNGDWHALFDKDGITAGDFNGRLLKWINQRLSSSHSSLGQAKHEFAVSQGYQSWGSIGGLTFAPESLIGLFDGVTVGGYWEGDNPANTSATWVDSTALGNNLTNTGTGFSDKFELTTVRGRICYRQAALGGNICNFALPAISINRRSHSFFVFFRKRSVPRNADRAFASFGPGLTDCLYSNDSAYKVRLFGTGAQSSNIVIPSHMACFIASAGASGVKLRLNGVEQTLSAFTAGNVTGGRLFSRTDGYSIQGEVYECGLLDRELSAGDIAAIEARHQSLFGPWPTYGQVLIEGDSLSEGQGFATNLGWTRLLDDDLAATYKQVSVAQAGTSLNAEIGSVSTRAAIYSAGLAKNVAVQVLGTNDLGVLARTSSQVLTDLQTWCTTMKSAGWKTIVCTIAKRDDTGWNATKEGHRVSVNSGIAGLTSLDAVCDIAALAELSNTANTTYFNADKLHWTSAAQAAVKNAVKSVVQAV